jgi:hypothetical protein
VSAAPEIRTSITMPAIGFDGIKIDAQMLCFAAFSSRGRCSFRA